MTSTARRLPRTAGRLALLVVCTAAWGCSSPKSAVKASSKAQTISLQARDLPDGWPVQGAWQPPGAGQRTQLYACLGTPVPALTSQAASSTFKGASGVVTFSVTQVFASPAAATADFAALRSKAYTGCAPALATSMFATLPPGTTFGNLDVAGRDFPAVKGGSVAYRFTMPVTMGDVTATAIGDTVTVLDGAAQVTVTFVGTSDPAVALAEPAVVTSLFAHS